MATNQQTLGDNTPALDPDTLRQYLEDWKWSHYEVADELDVTPDAVMDAIYAHDIEYNWHACGANASGVAKTLWEMDPDDLDQYTNGGESA